MRELVLDMLDIEYDFTWDLPFPIRVPRFPGEFPLPIETKDLILAPLSENVSVVVIM